LSYNCIKAQLVALAALWLFTGGCGNDSSKHHSGSPSAEAGEAGESNAGAAGACETCHGGEGGAGADNGAAGEGGEGGEASECNADTVLVSPPTNARRARSAGFQGTSQDYLKLFDVPCTIPSDCTTACMDAGGQAAMCDAAECLPNVQSGNDCAPAPVWDNLGGIQAEDSSTAAMCQLILVNTAYRDVLLTDRFKLELPSAAIVRGITVEVRRAGDDSVSDDSVRLIKGGQLGTAERALPQTWSPEVAWITYGGPTDLWGEQWTAADMNSDQFGVSLSAAYGKNVGNTLAYVDQVRVTVNYQVLCN
jgi:hypothetical protein